MIRLAASGRASLAAAVLIAARLAGAALWAAGNEPGWSLQLFPERLVLVTDYGETTIQTAAPTPVDEGETTTYTAHTEAHDVVVTVDREACQDSMHDGDPLPARVVVRFDGKLLRGCGEPLTAPDALVDSHREP